MVAQAVTQRTHEIGVRIALGAGHSDVAALVLRHSAALVGSGLGLGFLGAWSATGVLRSLLYEVEPTDPVAFLSLAAATVLVAFATSGVPALRATRVDPLVALRHE